MPQVKLKRFSNEYNLSVRYKHNGKGLESYEYKDFQFIWKKGKAEAHIYPIENGYEIEAVLNEKPKSNVIEFTIQTKGVGFHYQPALTEEEIAKGYHRPDNVIGSYAVYAEKVKKTYVGRKQYGTGKIAHIYRPKCVDANGVEVWAELKIDESVGLLSVIVPQEFLDTAVYPVIVDPTIGYDTIGGSNIDLGSSNEAIAVMVNTVSAVTGDVCTGISFYAKKEASNETVAVSLYTVSGGVPVTKSGTESSINVNSTTAQWWSSGATSDALTNGVEYCVAYGGWGGGIGSENTQVYYDTLTDASSYATTTTLPATWNEQAPVSNMVSLYATFTRAPIDINYTYSIFIDKANP